MPENAKRPAMIAFCLAAILLVTYSIALFVAGDFIIPVALALVGDPHDWLPTQVLGWASIVGLVFVTIWFRHDPLKLAIWQLNSEYFSISLLVRVRILQCETEATERLGAQAVCPVSNGIRAGCRNTHCANRTTT
jgi:hypothetical protein